MKFGFLSLKLAIEYMCDAQLKNVKPSEGRYNILIFKEKSHFNSSKTFIATRRSLW
jgi:hypothetical protein